MNQYGTAPLPNTKLTKDHTDKNNTQSYEQTELELPEGKLHSSSIEEENPWIMAQFYIQYV